MNHSFGSALFFFLGSVTVRSHTNDTGEAMIDLDKKMALIEQGKGLIDRAKTARVGREFPAETVPTVIASFEALLELAAQLAMEVAYEEPDSSSGIAAE